VAIALRAAFGLAFPSLRLHVHLELAGAVVLLELALFCAIRARSAQARLREATTHVLTLERMVEDFDAGRAFDGLPSHAYRHARIHAESGTEHPRHLAHRFRPAKELLVRCATTLVAISGIGFVLATLAQLSEDWSGSRQRTWHFVDAISDPSALGFSTKGDESGAWTIASVRDATGARALVNEAGSASAKPAVAVAHEPLVRDVLLSTRCRATTDRPDQACGLVFRYLDDETHYVARVDAIAAAVVLSVIVDGEARTVREAPVRIEPGSWSLLTVRAAGHHVLVSWNGQTMIDVLDRTLTTPGGVGMWAPADCVAFFDQLTVHPYPFPEETTHLPLFVKQL
jgi:hypothetical protein